MLQAVNRALEVQIASSSKSWPLRGLPPRHRKETPGVPTTKWSMMTSTVEVLTVPGIWRRAPLNTALHDNDMCRKSNWVSFGAHQRREGMEVVHKKNMVGSYQGYTGPGRCILITFLLYSWACLSIPFIVVAARNS